MTIPMMLCHVSKVATAVFGLIPFIYILWFYLQGYHYVLAIWCVILIVYIQVLRKEGHMQRRYHFIRFYLIMSGRKKIVCV